jgi:hypothetical protein
VAPFIKVNMINVEAFLDARKSATIKTLLGEI